MLGKRRAPDLKKNLAVTFTDNNQVIIYTRPPLECKSDLYSPIKRKRNDMIRHELNEFKLRHMMVHPKSRGNTKVSRIPVETFEERAERIRKGYGETISVEEREEMELEINNYAEYVACYVDSLQDVDN